MAWAISSINLLRNSIPIEQAHELVKIMQAKEKLTTLCDLSGNEATLDFSNQGLGAGDAVLIANDISNMGALLQLNIADNRLNNGASRMDHIGPAIAASTSITSLKIAGNCIDMNGGVDQVVRMLKDNGALTSLHVGQNNIPEKEIRGVMTIAMHMDSMKILCEVPFKDKTITKLDVSGKNLGMEGALVIAGYLDGNGAMTSLNLASNYLGIEGAKSIAACLPKCT
jgi:Ran GTPase-activating protein (RanGAP) involved in mRNA processing and transport